MKMEKAKDKKVGVSERKLSLAQGTTSRLEAAFGKEIPLPLKEAFTALFMSMQSKTLERFQGLLTGVESTTVE